MCRFSHNTYLHHASELPNWDKSDKIFKQIILVTSKAEEKIPKLHCYYFGNFHENVGRPHEKNPPTVRRVKKLKSKLFDCLQRKSNEIKYYLPLKSNEIKYFYELFKEERHEKSLKIMIKSLKIMIYYKTMKVWITIDYFLDILI